MCETDAMILVVGEDPEIRSMLQAGLEAEGWTVIEATNRKEIISAIDHGRVDLVALDMTLGAEEGLELAHSLRQQGNFPILKLIDAGNPDDRLHALAAAADDFILKPFHMKEVVLRIKRMLERYRHEVSADLTLSFDNGNFDLRRRIVKHLDGKVVPLTEIELKLLDLFVRHSGRVLSRDEISQRLHGREWAPYDRTIDTHVARLRRKIEASDGGPSLIRSVRGVGYVFTGDVVPATENVSRTNARKFKKFSHLMHLSGILFPI